MAGTLNTETGQDVDPNEPGLQKYFSSNQTLLLRGIEDNRTGLIFRIRIDWNPSLFGDIIYKGLVKPMSFVMTRKMLINIGRRAEAATASTDNLPFKP